MSKDNGAKYCLPSSSSEESDEGGVSMLDTLPWEKFSRWIYCMCVVTFDLELGQSIEVIYPGDKRLTANEKSSICYLSFPDSNSGVTQDCNFYFRFRRSYTYYGSTASADYMDRIAAPLDTDSCHFYGFVHFRQKKDPSLPRGYFQKSLVLLSVLPLYEIYAIVVGIIADAFFISGEPAIEAACHDIDQWPIPSPGASFHLPILGNVLKFVIPSQSDKCGEHEDEIFKVKLIQSDENPLITSILKRMDITENMLPVISHVQLLWELVLTGEPIIVLAPNPTDTTSMVHALTMMIWPLRYSNDYRPFLTIHDNDFGVFTATNSCRAAILGITNPLFIKYFKYWPHIIRLVPSEAQHAAVAKKRIKIWDESTLETKQGLFSQYKRCLQKDKKLIKDILNARGSNNADENILQPRLMILTRSFMIPLEDYAKSLLPAKKKLSPFKKIPRIGNFSEAVFMRYFVNEARLSQDTGIKGDWRGLYYKFFTSCNFQDWLARKMVSLEKELGHMHLQMLCSTNFNREMLQKHSQVEIVDLVLKMNRIRDSQDLSMIEREKLDTQISSILSAVDDDLKSVLLSNNSLQSSFSHFY